MMRFDLEKESGYSDPFFEKKFNSLMGLSKDDNASSDKNLLNLHLSFNTIKDFKYVPTKKTSKLFWTYLRSNNLLDSTSDIDTADEEKISLLEKATHERNYNEKDLLNIYKKFQFSVDQLLNIEREKEDLSNKDEEPLVEEDASSSEEEVVQEKPYERKNEEKYISEQQMSGIYAGPAVRKLAREFGIDLKKVSPSGPRNRILKEDLHNFVKSNLSSSSNGIPIMPSIDFSQFGEVEEVDLTKFQKTSALNLQQSWITIPHVTQHDEAEVTHLLELRKKLLKKYKTKVSPLAFFAKGVCRLLDESVLFNSSIDMNTMKKNTSSLSKIGLRASRVLCILMRTHSLVLYMHKIM